MWCIMHQAPYTSHYQEKEAEGKKEKPRVTRTYVPRILLVVSYRVDANMRTAYRLVQYLRIIQLATTSYCAAVITFFFQSLK